MSRAWCPHRYEDVGVCLARRGPGRCSHRQRQNLLVELAYGLGMPYRNGKQVC